MYKQLETDLERVVRQKIKDMRIIQSYTLRNA